MAFGTSGHRGSALDTAFNEGHIVAITSAIFEYRRDQGYDGPLFVGRDTHALSDPAWGTALEVLAANDVRGARRQPRRLDADPGVSHAILRRQPGRRRRAWPTASW